MKRAQRFLVLIAVVTLVMALGLIALATVTGTRGYAIGSRVALTGLDLGETPMVSLNGPPGTPSASNPGIQLLTLGSVGARSVSMVGSHGEGGFVTATSTASDIQLLGLQIDSVTTSCYVDESGVNASVQVAGGSLGGQSLLPSPAPGTTLKGGPISIVLNQQTESSGPGSHEVTVVGLEVVVDTLLVDGVITLGEVRCGLDFAAANDPPSPATTTTPASQEPTSGTPSGNSANHPVAAVSPGGSEPSESTTTTPGDVATTTLPDDDARGSGLFAVDDPPCQDCLPGFVAPLVLSSFGAAVLVTVLFLRGGLNRVWRRVSSLTSSI